MSDPLGFGKYVPGFDFLQNLAKQAAGGAVQGVQQNLPQLPDGEFMPPMEMNCVEKDVAARITQL